MRTDYVTQIEDVLGNVAVGVVVLSASDLRIFYANRYILERIADLQDMQHILPIPTSIGTQKETSSEIKVPGEQQWQHRSIADVLPEKIHRQVQPILEQVARNGRQAQHEPDASDSAEQHKHTTAHYVELPFEGFLESRGRTYWNIQIEYRASAPMIAMTESEEQQAATLLLTIEDVTEQVRSRLQIAAIHAISSASVGPTSLHVVLDRILQVLQDMFGSQRCAIFLLEHSPATSDENSAETTSQSSTHPLAGQKRSIVTTRIVAQKGLHPISHNWQTLVDEHVLLASLIQQPGIRVITDTRTEPQLHFPYLNIEGSPCRPGSVLSVPIFEPTHTIRQKVHEEGHQEEGSTVFGTIEVYHLRARGFPKEEVLLLEQFARQAGLAIHNARLLGSIDHLARSSARNARQKEKIMQAIPDGVVIFDPRWRVADFNQAARDLLGWSDEVLSLTIDQAFARSKATFFNDFYRRPNLVARIEQRALAQSEDNEKIHAANGQHYHIHTTYTPIRDELGNIFAFIVIYHDVSDAVAARERIEAEVVARTAEIEQRNTALQIIQREQELLNVRMSTLLESLPVGVILVSATNNSIVMSNRQAIQLLLEIGYTIEAASNSEEAQQRVVGMDCEQLLRSITMYDTTNTPYPYEDWPLYTALHEGQSNTTEMHALRKDGQTIYLFVSAAPLRDAQNNISSAVLVYQETTRIKMLERSREDFFTTMAHELKTPLANIRAHLSALLAQDMEWTSEQQYTLLQTADQQVDRLVGMINHFLDASRVEAEALRLEIEPLLLPELIEDLEERLQALITSSQRRLIIQQPDQVPAVRGDYELIISVLTNLLSNAFRYTPEGDTVELKIELVNETQRQRAGGVRISVSDHGPGISKEQQSMLFTRFSTFAALNRPSSESPGQPEITRRLQARRWSPATGLGLYISRGIIEAHGSQLQLISTLGQGATFLFNLPIYREKRRKARENTAKEGVIKENILKENITKAGILQDKAARNNINRNDVKMQKSSSRSTSKGVKDVDQQ